MLRASCKYNHCIFSQWSWYDLFSGSCLYLKKDDSAIYSYSCSSFQSGCHNTSFSSQDLFQRKSQKVMYLTLKQKQNCGFIIICISLIVFYFVFMTINGSKCLLNSNSYRKHKGTTIVYKCS